MCWFALLGILSIIGKMHNFQCPGGLERLQRSSPVKVWKEVIPVYEMASVVLPPPTEPETCPQEQARPASSKDIISQIHKEAVTFGFHHKGTLCEAP